MKWTILKKIRNNLKTIINILKTRKKLRIIEKKYAKSFAESGLKCYSKSGKEEQRMLHSNKRKLTLSGWLKEVNEEIYNSSLKLQKFLFFYEICSKVEKDDYDLTSLRGYKNGPVFSTVYGDYTKERDSFDSVSKSFYTENSNLINNDRANQCLFIVNSLSEKELYELTHEFNIWKAKEKRILSEERQVSLSENDFNKDDEELLCTLKSMYPSSLVEKSKILKIDKKNFVFSNEDYKKITVQHLDTLLMLSDKTELHNPVFVSIDPEGCLEVD